MFPPVEHANEDGLLAIGGDLDVSTLRRAYRRGIFPWPVEGLPLLWFAPPQRAILRFDEFHVARRLSRFLKNAAFEIRIDYDFEAVIRACAGVRRDGFGTWITDEMIAAYVCLHRAGDAHSIESYRDGELVGGLYGVSFGAYFCGESMFFKASGASKAALIHLVEYLWARNVTWIDIQMLTPLFTDFGAREVPRAEFMKMLKRALAEPVQLFP